MIGTLEKYLYSNTEHGYMIALFLEEGTKNPITIKGYMIEVEVSQKLQISGSWDSHPEHGKQFRVKESMPVEPANREGIISYLSSGEFPGIGPKTAERIFDMFGEKTSVLN